MSTQAMNMLARWIEDPNSEAFKLHLARVVDYLWVAEDGMRMQVLVFIVISTYILCMT